VVTAFWVGMALVSAGLVGAGVWQWRVSTEPLSSRTHPMGAVILGVFLLAVSVMAATR
jgi:hypothetical protein